MLKTPAATFPCQTLLDRASPEPTVWPNWDQLEETLSTCIQSLDETQLYTEHHLATLRQLYCQPGAQCQLQWQVANYTQALETCKTIWDAVHNEYCSLRQRTATWHQATKRETAPGTPTGHKPACRQVAACSFGPSTSPSGSKTTDQNPSPAGQTPASAELAYKVKTLRKHTGVITQAIKSNLAALACALALMYGESAPKEDEPA